MTDMDHLKEIGRLRAALKRLASPIAFHTSKVSTPEDRARMYFAEHVLRGEPLDAAEKMAIDKTGPMIGRTKP